MPGSGVRAALPRAFALWPARASYVVQVHTFRERADSLEFEHRIEPYSGDQTLGLRVRERHLAIEVTNALIVARIQRRCGSPVKRIRQPSLRLPRGMYGRAMTNGRFTGYHGQSYEEDTYNFALLDQVVDDIFIAGEPAATLDDRADLF